MSSNSRPKHKAPLGSLGEVVRMTLPLMVAMLSASLMMFADRLILARVSTQAMNAAVAAGMTAALVTFGACGIVGITEVFVGRANGAKEYSSCSAPAHQMLFFSCLSALIFVPVGLFAGRLVIPEGLHAAGGLAYFRILMYFGPAIAAQAALSAYFVGLGKPRVVLVAAVAGNILNIGLDLLLVFGIPGYMPPLGAKGAAIATGISQSVQCLILALLFFGKEQRQTYGTARFFFRPRLFLDCLRVGTPVAAGHMLEIAAWAVATQMYARAGPEYLTIQAIGQSFFMLFGFVTEGLQKGVMSLASNYIGAQRFDVAQNVTRSSIRFLLLMAALLAIPLLIYPTPLIGLFLTGHPAPEMFTYARIGCACVWLCFLLDGSVWILAGTLTAGGDTKFVMWMNGAAAWGFMILPCYLALFVLRLSPGALWGAAVLYASVNALCFYLRYRKGHWQRITLTSTTPSAI